MWTTTKQRLQVGTIFKGVIPIIFADFNAHQRRIFNRVDQILRDGA